MLSLVGELNLNTINFDWIAMHKYFILSWLDYKKLRFGGGQLDIEFLAVFKS